MNLWDVPPQPEESRGDLQWSGGAPGEKRILSRKFYHGIVRALSNVFGWTLISQVSVYDDEGEHTPLYLKAFRWARGAMWGLCIEVRDWAGRGALRGLEALVMSYGQDTGTTRRVFWAIVGTMEGKDRAHFDRIYDASSRFGDPNPPTVGTTFNSDVRAMYALAMLGGSGIKWSDDPAFAIAKADPTTGVIGLWKDRLCLIGILTVPPYTVFQNWQAPPDAFPVPVPPST